MLNDGSNRIESTRGFTKVLSEDNLTAFVRGKALRKIQRNVDQDTGDAQTVVYNEDGTCTAFGESTMCSLLQSEEAEVQKMINKLTDFELQGLVYEFNQRLLKTADDYETLLRQLEFYIEECDIAFFGLTRSSTEQELDKAYRKKARELHPDKNGNTEEANAKFQDMKERYERLKKKFREHRSLGLKQSSESKAAAPARKTSPDINVGQQFSVPGTLPAEPIELPDATNMVPQEDAKPEEPLDRKQLDESCWRLLRRTKAYQEKIGLTHQKIDATKQELQELRAVAPMVQQRIDATKRESRTRSVNGISEDSRCESL